MGVRYTATLNLMKILAGIAICSPLLACSSNNVSYISRQALKSDSLYLIEKSTSMEKRPTSYGALKYHTDDMDDNEGYLFLLQKKKSLYQAETLFKKTKDKKYYLSMGLDYKKKAPTVGFRVEF